MLTSLLGKDAPNLSPAVIARLKGEWEDDFRSPIQLSAVIPDQTTFYVPAATTPSMLASHGDHELNVVGRLRPGVTIAAAQAELKLISFGRGAAIPDTNSHISAVIAPLSDDLVSDVRQSLWVLLGATALIVLITCVNVANLLLVRATATIVRARRPPASTTRPSPLPWIRPSESRRALLSGRRPQRPLRRRPRLLPLQPPLRLRPQFRPDLDEAFGTSKLTTK